VGNWRQAADGHGFMATVSSVIASAERRSPGCIPDLRQAGTLVVVSDYGGAHVGSRVDSYSFLVLAMDDSFRLWDEERRHWRQRFRLGVRRLEFKSLGDRVRGRELTAFLRSALNPNGFLLTILVEKSFGSFFATAGPIESVPLSPRSLERAGRIVHLVSLLLSGVCAPGQNVLWFTDQDEIAPNDDGVRALTTLFGRVVSNYLEFDLGHLRCATTTKCDDGSLQIEDLAAIPDLAAGAAADLVSMWLNRGWTFHSRITVPTPQGMRGKSGVILSWLAAPPDGSLGRMIAGMYVGADNRRHVASLDTEALV
jgi:hypothetical protein